MRLEIGCQHTDNEIRSIKLCVCLQCQLRNFLHSSTGGRDMNIYPGHRPNLTLCTIIWWSCHFLYELKKILALYLGKYGRRCERKGRCALLFHFIPKLKFCISYEVTLIKNNVFINRLSIRILKWTEALVGKINKNKYV
jgi:hypothetical protein